MAIVSLSWLGAFAGTASGQVVVPVDDVSRPPPDDVMPPPPSAPRPTAPVVSTRSAKPPPTPGPITTPTGQYPTPTTPGDFTPVVGESGVPVEVEPGFSPVLERPPAERFPGPATNVARTDPTQPRVVPPVLGQPPGVTDVASIEAAPFATPEAVANAQLTLAGLGLYRGPITGTLTGPTRAALRQFQEATALPPTGNLDTRTMINLGLDPDPALILDDDVATQTLVVESAGGVVGGLEGSTALVPVDDRGIPTVVFRQDLPLVTP